MFRSAPRRIFSSASPKSSRVTRSRLRRAARMAASLTRFFRSAPTMPGVAAAMSPRSTPSRERHVAGVDLEDVPAARLVGRVDRHLAVEAPGRRSALSSSSGRFVAAMTMTPWPAGEAVHLGEDLVERLLALVVVPNRAAAAARAADRVELVDEDDRRARPCSPGRTGRGRGSRRRRRPSRRTPRRETEKNGTSASPATARASSVLPVPGGPDSSTPLGILAPSAAVAARVAEEVDDLAELRLGLLDAGHVGERRALVGGVVALRTRAPEARRAARARAATIQTSKPTSSSAGPKPRSSDCQSGRSTISGRALTLAPLSISSSSRRSSPAKAGRTVANTRARSPSETRTGARNRPLISSLSRGDLGDVAALGLGAEQRVRNSGGLGRAAHVRGDHPVADEQRERHDPQPGPARKGFGAARGGRRRDRSSLSRGR